MEVIAWPVAFMRSIKIQLVAAVADFVAVKSPCEGSRAKSK